MFFNMPEKKRQPFHKGNFKIRPMTVISRSHMTRPIHRVHCNKHACGNHSTQNIKTCHAKNETNTMIGFKICGCMFTCCFIFCFVDTCAFGLHKINKKQNLHQLHAYMHLLVLIKRLDTNLQLVPNHHRKFKKSIGKPKSTFSNIKKDMFPKLFLS